MGAVGRRERGRKSWNPKFGLRALQPVRRRGSQAVDRPFGRPMTDPDRENAVDPVVVRRGGLEHRANTEIIASRIDNLAGAQPLHHDGRSIAKTVIGHADEGAVAGLEYQADVERRCAILAVAQPVAAAVEHRAGEPLSFERPAVYQADAAVRGGGIADGENRSVRTLLSASGRGSVGLPDMIRFLRLARRRYRPPGDRPTTRCRSWSIAGHLGHHT